MTQKNGENHAITIFRKRIELSDNVFGNEQLNLAAAAVPAIYGIPVLLLIPYARRVYLAEVEKQEAAGSA